MKLINESFLNLNLIKGLLKSKSLREYEVEIVEVLDKHIIQFISDKAKEVKNKSRIIKNDLSKDHIPAESNLSGATIKSLPSWVQADIKNSYLIGNSKKVIQTSSGKKYHISNSLNSLPGGEWTYFLNSVINTRYPTNGD